MTVTVPGPPATAKARSAVSFGKNVTSFNVSPPLPQQLASSSLFVYYIEQLPCQASHIFKIFYEPDEILTKLEPKYPILVKKLLLKIGPMK